MRCCGSYEGSNRKGLSTCVQNAARHRERENGATVNFSTIMELSIKIKNGDTQHNKLADADAVDLGRWEGRTSRSNDQ